MDMVGVSIYAEYRDVLEIDAGEWTALLDTVLINLTSFFRDENAWEALRTEHLVALTRRGARSGRGAPAARAARRPTASRRSCARSSAPRSSASA